MLKKLIILQLVVTFLFLACNPTPFIPAVKVEIKIDYYRMNAPALNGSAAANDKAVVRCSWEGYISQDMQKVEENHFFYQAQQNIEAPTLTYGLDKYRIRIGDYLLENNSCIEEAYVNGKRLTFIEYEAGMAYLVFWVNSQGQIITTPQGN